MNKATPIAWFARVLLFLVVSFNPVSSVADELQRERAWYLDAERALAKGDRASFNRKLNQLQDYPLYPYLVERDLSQRLQLDQAQSIRIFLSTYSSTPVAQRLRRDWLSKLAREAAWDDYLKDYRDGLGISYECWYSEAQYRAGSRTEAFKAVPALWTYGRSRPDACDAIFKLWIESGGLSDERVWRRIEMALGNGEIRLARYLGRPLPATQRKWVDLWIEAHKKPAETLEQNRIPVGEKRSKAVALHAMKRWARYDSPAVAAELDRLAQRYGLSDTEIAPLVRQLAVFLASRQDMLAEPFLARVDSASETESVRAWRVRVALSRGDWQAALKHLEAMPQSESSTAQWRYWRARALEALGRDEQAQALYRELAGHRDYHSFLAADRIGAAYRLGHRPMAISSENLTATAELPGIKRARELFILNRDVDARREWRAALAEANRDRLRAAALLADDWGWHSQAIATVARAKDWNDLDLRFPINYQAEVMEAARDDAIRPQWVYGIMRQESMFQTDARSSAGAMGLMQLMPATAKRVARKLEMPYSGTRDLLQPETNIRLGSRYLRMSLDDLQDRPILATAGYNAGPHRVIEWLPVDGPVDADIWIETVPFYETRDYLKKVLEYSVIYEARMGLPSEFLREQMAPIPKRYTPDRRG